MKKIGTLNTHLSHAIARMGHMDRLVVCDSGLPIPRESQVIDLALTRNVPRFIETLRVILEELQVEGAYIATEMVERSNGVYSELTSLLNGVEIRQVPHDEFKQLTEESGNVVFVRTGEATPFANVMLVAGVTF
ncbi:MAG TPA: D-ribose pyranase [Rhodothermales bacterium]